MVVGRLILGVLAASVGLATPAACASKDSEKAAVPAPTLLAVRLAADVQVWVDDVELGVSPLPEKEVTPGVHTVRVKTACGEVTRAGFEVLAERMTLLTAADVPGFATAELHVTATTHLGEAVADLAVFVDDQQLTAPAAGAPWAVPACRLRVRVAAVGRDDLGGVIADIEFDADAKNERAVVLAPGPDMVRIPAGSFVFGPNEFGMKWLDEMTRAFEFDLVGPPWDEEDPRLGAKVEMPAFEIDKTEVTVAQYMACRRAAKRTWCYDDEDCIEVGGCARHATAPSSTGYPLGADHGAMHAKDPRVCFGDPVSADFGIRDAQKPLNCVVSEEAEKYCQWAGKRLATDVEWEYVARSRQTEYSRPWGEAKDEDCSRSVCRAGPHRPGPSPVCSKPSGNTTDGVCDMMGNVAELTVLHQIPGRGAPKYPNTMGSSIDDGTSFVYERGRSAPFATGFRCVRDAAVPAAAQPNSKRRR